MANSDTHDTGPLITMQTDSRPRSGSFPEVVPVENLKNNTIRHDDAWFYRQRTFSPSSHSTYSSDPQALSAPTYPQTSDFPSSTETLGIKGFHKTSRKKFALLTALVVFLFTALALSAGLGIPLAKCRNRFDPNTYAPMDPVKIKSVKKSGFCDNNGNLNRDRGSIFTTRDKNNNFDLHCGVVFPESQPAFDSVTKSGIANGVVHTKLSIISYSVDDCIEACASMNRQAKAGNTTNPPCQSVTFLAGMQDAVNNQGGNCFLKNATLNDLNSAYKDSTAVSAEVHRLRAEG